MDLHLEDESPRSADVIMLEAAPSAPAGGVLRGVVRDAETGEPLAFANVILKGTSRGAATDSLGRFEFAGLAPGNHIAVVPRRVVFPRL